VTASHRAADVGNYRVESLKSALLAYVAAQQFDRAEEVINVLEQSGGTSRTKIE
jgi:hypothetical protein